MQLLAPLMALVYPLRVPFAIFLMLWRIRDKLNPDLTDAPTDEISVIENLVSSDLYHKIPIAQFTQQLRPKFW